MPWRDELFEAACKADRLELAMWLVDEGHMPITSETLGSLVRKAGELGKIECLDWCLDLAEEYSDREDVQRMIAQYAAQGAADYARVNVLEYLHARELLWQDEEGQLQEHAAWGGDLATVTWLKERGFAPTQEAVSSAMRNGQLAMVKYLMDQEHLTPTDSHGRGMLALIAAKRGHVACLQLLYERNMGDWTFPPFITQLMGFAGTAEDIAALKWLHETFHAPWPLRCFGTMLWSLEALQWALPLGCPWGSWSSYMCQTLLREHRYEQLEWIHSNGCPCTCPRSDVTASP